MVVFVWGRHQMCVRLRKRYLKVEKGMVITKNFPC